MNLLRWYTSPDVPPTVNRKNFINVEIDAVGIGLANAAAPFLPVFLTQLGATAFHVSLLTAMPAVTGFLLAIPVGRFLQSRRKIVPWFSAARLLVVLSYALTGLITFVLPPAHAVFGILGIWAMATLPQTVVAIGFTVVMNAVAGPNSRYELMTRRWSILGFTTSVMVLLVGEILDQIGFPLNFQTVFMALSIGGLISYYFSSHIDLPESEPPPVGNGLTLRQRIKEIATLIWSEKPFISFNYKRLIFLAGTSLAAPIFPIYFVKEVHASNAWIGIISTAQSAILIIGYFFWSRQSRHRGNRPVLIWTTLGLSLYPALVSQTHQVWLIALFAGMAGVFQAGLDLVFFDELMKTVPVEYSATFVSVAQSILYLSAIASPIIGSFLAGTLGLGGALLVSAALRMIGFILFATTKKELQPAFSPS